MELENELYAERRRREALTEAQASGSAQPIQELDHAVRTKLGAAWDDALRPLGRREVEFRTRSITERTRRSIGQRMRPSDMEERPFAKSEELLSLLEAEHQNLRLNAENLNLSSGVEEIETLDRERISTAVIADAPENFRSKVNEIFESHDVGLRLTASSQLVPMTSHEMHDAVVAPTLYLLHEQSKFAATEKAYQKALTEIRNRDAGDAITDAGTALQEALTALGCEGTNIGALLSSAKNQGLIGGSDSPLAEVIVKSVNWVAAQRNQGEAHFADTDADLDDAWMAVHVVGALIIRVAAADRKRST